MPCIEKYAEPKTASDVAKAIRLFVMDAFNWTPAGSALATGGLIEVELESGDVVTITVTDASEGASR